MAIDRRGKERTTGEKRKRDRIEKFLHGIELFKQGRAVCKRCKKERDIHEYFFATEYIVVRNLCKECRIDGPYPSEVGRANKRYLNQERRLDKIARMKALQPMPKRQQFTLYMWGLMWCSRCHDIKFVKESFEPGAAPGDRCVKCLSEVRKWTRPGNKIEARE